MDAFLKNLILENLIKESQPEDEVERAFLRTVLEKNLFTESTSQESGDIFGNFRNRI